MAPLKPAGKNSIFRFASVKYNTTTRKWGLATSANWTDYRTSTLSRVRNQGSCGSSWAMAAVTAVELAYAVARNASNDMQAPRYLSTQQVLSCGDSKKGNCTGGWPTTALDYVVKTTGKYGGMVTEGNYPYTGNTTCTYGTKDDDDHSGGDKKKPSSCDTSKFLPAVYAPGREHRVAQVHSQPAPCFPFPTPTSSFQGVYSDSSCAEGQVDHAVVVMGYTFDSPGPLWIIKNSWGKTWGMQNLYLFLRSLSLPPLLPPLSSGGVHASRHQPVRSGNVSERRQGLSYVPLPVALLSLSPFPPLTTAVVVCTRADINPCGVGTCLNDGKGWHTCLCPRGFILAPPLSALIPACPVRPPRTHSPLRALAAQLVYGLYGIPKDKFYDQNPDLDSSDSKIKKGKKVNVKATSDTINCDLFYPWNWGNRCGPVAALFGITIARLEELNPGLTCPTGAYPGQQICVREGSGLAIPLCAQYHVIAPADTGLAIPLCAQYHVIAPPEKCVSIKQQYGLSPPLTFPFLPPPIQICVREGTGLAIPLCAQYHVIAPPDTCRSIRQQYGLSWTTYFALNPGVFCANLYPAATVDGVNAIPSGAQAACGTHRTSTPPSLSWTTYFSLNPGAFCANLYPAHLVIGEICVKAAFNATINYLAPRDTSAMPYNAAYTSLLTTQHHSLLHSSHASGLLSAHALPQQESQQLLQQQQVQPLQTKRRCQASYTVVRGDFCARIIALKFQYNTRRMADLNNGYVCTDNRLFVGLVLCTFR
ncbi:unnamed protein product [Closterium sp. Yama58-4]|nr:unnamed protein product [Closterium sp. Yama58-4]